MNNLIRIHTIQVRATQAIYSIVHFKASIDYRCRTIQVRATQAIQLYHCPFQGFYRFLVPDTHNNNVHVKKINSNFIKIIYAFQLHES